MRVTVATPQDRDAWLDLAAEVEPLFGPMVHEASFLTALERNLARGTALCVREDDGPPGTALMGGLLFSAHSPIYRIGWFAVAAHCRQQGVGSLLMCRLLDRVGTPGEVWVTTFGAGVPDGEAARSFYRRFGFVPMGQEPDGPDGAARDLFCLRR